MSDQNAAALLKQAADAARSLLPALQEKRAKLFEELQALDREIQNLMLITDAVPTSSRPKINKGFFYPEIEGLNRIEKLIVEVLENAEELQSAEQIRLTIHQKTRQEYGKSTIFNALTSLKKREVLMNSDGRWGLEKEFKK